MSYEIILGTFENDTDTVNEILTSLESSQDTLGIAEAVAIIKPEDGDDIVKVMGEHKKKARRIGAVAGAVLGILGGPPTMIALGVIGAAAGNLVSNLTHAGISKKMIEAVESGLKPGGSAVLVIVEQEHHRLILKSLSDRGASIINESIESHEIEGKYFMSPSGGMSQTQ